VPKAKQKKHPGVKGFIRELEKNTKTTNEFTPFEWKRQASGGKATADPQDVPRRLQNQVKLKTSHHKMTNELTAEKKKHFRQK